MKKMQIIINREAAEKVAAEKVAVEKVTMKKEFKKI